MHFGILLDVLRVWFVALQKCTKVSHSLERVKPAQTGGRNHRGTHPWSLFIGQADHFTVKDVGLNLQPEWALGPTTNGHDRIEVTAIFLVDIKEISKGVADAFQHGADKVVALMRPVDTGEAPPDISVRVWRPFTHDVRRVQQAIGPNRRLGSTRYELCKVFGWRKGL